MRLSIRRLLILVLALTACAEGDIGGTGASVGTAPAPTIVRSYVAESFDPLRAVQELSQTLGSDLPPLLVPDVGLPDGTTEVVISVKDVPDRRRGGLTVLRTEDGQALAAFTVDSKTSVPSCDDRFQAKVTDGEWRPTKVRTIEGCFLEQDGGLTFVEWSEGQWTYQASMSMPLQDAISLINKLQVVGSS